jgi:hypothetical protein
MFEAGKPYFASVGVVHFWVIPDNLKLGILEAAGSGALDRSIKTRVRV